MPTISVIVPVYNVEKYLHCCVDSILAQTFSDIEVLLVDDGSTDGSGAICDEYAQKDSRVRVFHKANGGVSSARNLGLDEAAGKWIMFVDSDDYIDAGLCGRLLSKVVDEDAAFFHFSVVRNGDVKRIFQENLKILEKFPLRFDLFYQRSTGEEKNGVLYDKSVAVFVWRALYFKRFIDQNKIRFDEQQKTGEDRVFIFRVLSKIKKLCVLDNEFGYFYFLRGNESLTGQKNLLRYRMDVFENHKRMDELEQELCRNNPELDMKTVKRIRLFRAAKMRTDVIINEFRYNLKNAKSNVEEYRKTEFFAFSISYTALLDVIRKKQYREAAKLVAVKLRMYGLLQKMYAMQGR